MAKRNYRGYYDDNIQGTVKYARTDDGKMLGFLTKVKSKSKKSGRFEEPSAEFRRIIARNINKIEKRLGSKILRTSKGLIAGSLGSGYWGVVFRLSNGNVLKVSKDPTEGGSAAFWKEKQKSKPDLLKGTAKVYDVFSVKRKKDKRLFYFVEREEVDTQSYIPSPVRQYLNKFVDEFHMFCSSNSKYSYLYLERAKIALEGLRRHSKGMAIALSYAWDKGLPLIDAGETNIGVRFKKNVGSKTKIGQWVIFDYGGLSQRCFDLVVKDSSGKKTNIKGILKSYCKKVTVLK